MLKKYWLATLLATGFFLFQTENIFACVCLLDSKPPAQKVADYTKRADAVFSGEVIFTTYRKMTAAEISAATKSNPQFFAGKKDFEIKMVKFAVTKQWKGSTRKKEITLLTETARTSDGTETSNSCEFNFQSGKEYLIFAYGKTTKTLKTAKCSGTQLMETGTKLLPFLSAGKTPKQ